MQVSHEKATSVSKKFTTLDPYTKMYVQGYMQRALHESTGAVKPYMDSESSKLKPKPKKPPA